MAGASTAQRGGPGAAGKGSGPLKGSKAPKAPKSPKPPGGSRPGGPRGPRPGGRLPGGLRRGPLVVAGLVVALLVAAGCTWVLYGSSWLRVEKVTTAGTEVLTPEQVLAAAAVPVGAPLVSVDTDEIEARLRGRLPRIDSVDVVRAWPHGIGLKVTERKPVLLIKKEASFVEVDSSGVRFDTVGQAPEGVPLLELSSRQSPSGRRFDEERLLHEAVRIAGDLPEAVRKETLQVKVRSYDSVVLELSGGRSVVWGSGEQGKAKARALTALLKAAPKADRFDVSVPTAPAVSGS